MTAMFTLLLLFASTVPTDETLLDYEATAAGSFSSAGQSAQDARYDVVEAVVVRIWNERKDGLWLYQEQAIVGGKGVPTPASKDKPYFQRVSHIYRLPGGELRRDNYVLKEPARFVGLGRHPAVAAPMQQDLGPAGCHNLIQRVARGHFISRTEGCRNGYKGAATMSSIAISTPDRYINWDRGFDASGKRIWGPEAGGYVFDRKAE
jgi:hypothetical protein